MYNNYSQPFIWVHGEEGANSYMVAPNHSIPLWDTQAQTIYVKSVDSMGKPTIEYLDYTKRVTVKPEDIIKDLQDKVALLTEQIESMQKGKKKNERTVSENESE